MTPDDVRCWYVSQAKRPTRVQVAERYRDLLVEHWDHLGAVDVAPLNHAILARHSIAGLEWIKREAWKAATTTVREHERSARRLWSW